MSAKILNVILDMKQLKQEMQFTCQDVMKIMNIKSLVKT